MTTSNIIPTRLRLTNKTVDAIGALPIESRARRYWDAECRGFYLLFSKAGSASFMLRYTKADGKDGDYAVSPADKCSVDMARSKARGVQAAIALHGIDPVAERRQSREAARNRPDLSFGNAAEKFIESRAKLRPGKSQLDEVYFLRKYLLPHLAKKELDRITQQDLEDLVDEIQVGVAGRARRKNANGKNTANACHRALKRVFSWAIKSEWTEKRNPADFPCRHPTGVNKRRGRLNQERFKIIWDELARSYNQFQRSRSSVATMLYMVTLQRPIDIARARRAHFNFKNRVWTIPKDWTKTGKEYVIPLSDVALEILEEAFSLSESPWLFPKAYGLEGHMPEHSLTSRWVILRDRLIGEGSLNDRDVELYDCRRFGRTQVQHELGFDLTVAEKVINHVESADMATRYDVQEIDDLVRQAQEKWGDEVRRMTGRSLGAMFAQLT